MPRPPRHHSDPHIARSLLPRYEARLNMATEAMLSARLAVDIIAPIVDDTIATAIARFERSRQAVAHRRTRSAYAAATIKAARAYLRDTIRMARSDYDWTMRHYNAYASDVARLTQAIADLHTIIKNANTQERA